MLQNFNIVENGINKKYGLKEDPAIAIDVNTINGFATVTYTDSKGKPRQKHDNVSRNTDLITELERLVGVGIELKERFK